MGVWHPGELPLLFLYVRQINCSILLRKLFVCGLRKLNAISGS